MKPLLEFHEVSKYFADLPVIHDFSLTLAPGEVISLVGPSGCGKSTLLRLAAGIEAPDAGQVKADFALDRVGFVFQDVRLLPWMTALDNVLFVLRDRIANPQERHDVAQAALAQVGLGDFATYYPGQLSGGMQKRVAIARALAIQAELLLFDEPFSDLDLPLRLRLLEAVRAMLQDQARSAIYVTHDVREALLISHRLLVLSARPAQIKARFTLESAADRATMGAVEERVIQLLSDEINDDLFDHTTQERAFYERGQARHRRSSRP